jgi:O-antigen/teichoic acid export membrane protein
LLKLSILSSANLKGSAINFALRFTSIFAKFLLVIYISKNLALEDLGVYNLIAVTVAWTVFVLGFEFNAYTSRQIVGEEKNIISGRLYNQFIFHLAGIAILCAISPLLVMFGFIPASLIIYFLLITILDQLSQECYRLLVTIDRPQMANLLYFVKSGFWVYPLLLLHFTEGGINLSLILAFWLGGTFFAMAMGVYQLVRLDVVSWKREYLNIPWIFEGINISFPFLIITIAQMTIDFSDRYFIDHFLGKKMVGIYSFYYGIVNVPMTLITNVLIAQYFSKIINAYKFNINPAERSKLIRNFTLQNIGFALVISMGCVVMIFPLLRFIGKEALGENIMLFYLMLTQVLIFSIQVVIQTILYAKHFDRMLLYSALTGAVANVVLNIVLIPVLGLYGATVSTIAAMLLILTIRAIAYYRQKTITYERI